MIKNIRKRLAAVTCMTGLLLYIALPNVAQATIMLSLTDGGGSVVNYSLSGSGTISPGFSVSSEISSRLRLPEDGSWSSFFTAGDFDNSGSVLLGVTNVTSGSFAATGNPRVFVDGVAVALDSGSFAADGDWQVGFVSDPAFRFQLSFSSPQFLYPALTGGEVISVSGSGSFDLGSGRFTDNFNIGSYLFAGDSGIDFAVTVEGLSSVPVPEPSSMALLAIGLIGVAGASSRWGRRRQI